ncbi:MAG TPA: hypothetical protein VFQ84_03620 [Arenimonas sp.]|uniref:hypothetical protein n=1 Tax=Arenimonas sp. TaxID=1872635 RepID=UPI002D7F122C|nr:hypothetical protein [Arenimonas sp.]HEU0152418.1 hypothetical protein [Arenimonas sp.]
MLFCGLLLAVLPVQAKVLRAQVDAVRSEVATLEGVRLVLSWPEGEASGSLELRAESAEMPLLGYRGRDLAWRCPLRRNDDGGWACAGGLQVAGGALHPLSLDVSPAATRAELAVGPRRISYTSLAAAPERHRLELARIPVDWLRVFLAGLWADGQWTAGEVGGRVDLSVPDRGPFEVDAALSLADIGLETPDGWLAAAGLQATMALGYREQAGRQRVTLELDSRGGEFLAQGLYAQLPTTPVSLALVAEQADGAGWRLPSFSCRDGEVLQASGSATLAADASLQDLGLSLSLGELAVARDRYLSGFLAPAGFSDLVLSGRASARVAMRGGRAGELSLELTDVNAIDPRQRFALAGLDGTLRWTLDAAGVDSALQLDGGALYGIGLGPSRLDFRSANGELRLRQPARIAVLGGEVGLDDLRWQAPTDAQRTRFQLGLTLDALDLGSLSQRLGWPPFTGRIGGRIPSARYEDNVLTLDGGLAMDVFGGSVALSSLVMERPFGVAPTLSADIAIEDIDMAPMTAAFGFGSISGRLDGRIAGLRMVDWSPVAFDARLETDEAWKGRRRISQRAVEDISKVGGAGLVAGLQTQVLKFFDDFGYARIGLACRLRDNVCAMDGVGSAGDGYTIVEGSGLPRIQVVGFRRQVDWPTLVDRLEAATTGQTPVIQ